jgi:hypothetical protein
MKQVSTLIGRNMSRMHHYDEEDIKTRIIVDNTFSSICSKVIKIIRNERSMV